MNFKSYLIELLPYYLAKKWIRYDDKQKCIINYDPLLPRITEEKSKFDYIISVQGLGFSGSGAVIDLLREYSCCKTFGGIDKEGSKSKGKQRDSGEIDFLRYSGVLFEIEKFIGDNNIFTKDALIKRLKCTLNSCSFFSSSEAKLLANQFYNQIIDFEIDTFGHADINGNTTDRLRNDCNIKVMKNLSVDDYISICRQFLTSLFNCYHQDHYQYMALDQLCSDCNFNNNHYLKYVPNLKTIIVYRDPRDVYSYAISKNVPWIAHQTANKFIKWYKNQTKNLNLNSTDYLVVQFEKLVNDYEKQVKRIENYLFLNSGQHDSLKSCFDPNCSMANIGIWKNCEKLIDDFNQIALQLKEFCYE